MQMTAANIQRAAKPHEGLFGVPMHKEAPSGKRAADGHANGRNYQVPQEAFAGMVSHEKEQGAVSLLDVMRGLLSPSHRANRRGEARLGSPKAREAIELKKAVLQTACEYVRDGRVWATKIRLDVGASVADERFRSRMAQLAYDSTGDAAAASELSKELNKLASRADGLLQPRGCVPSAKPLNHAVSVAMQVACAAVCAELDRRGHAYVVDDEGVVVFLRSEAAAKRVSKSMTGYMGKMLHAHVDPKSAEACAAGGVDIFGLCIILEDGQHQLRVHESLLCRVKDALRRTTARSRGISFAERLREIARIVSWGQSAMGLACDAREVFRELNDWMAAKFRVVLWKKWKLVRSHVYGLEAAGVSHDRAVALGSSHAGFWAAANSDGLRNALSYAVLRRMGFSFFLIESAW